MGMLDEILAHKRDEIVEAKTQGDGSGIPGDGA